jgi:hypothetical protein
MDIERLKVKEAGACNFCNRGKMSEDVCQRLEYPYSEITQISKQGPGCGMQVRICDECMGELVASHRLRELTD